MSETACKDNTGDETNIHGDIDGPKPKRKASGVVRNLQAFKQKCPSCKQYVPCRQRICSCGHNLADFRKQQRDAIVKESFERGANCAAHKQHGRMKKHLFRSMGRLAGAGYRMVVVWCKPSAKVRIPAGTWAIEDDIEKLLEKRVGAGGFTLAKVLAEIFATEFRKEAERAAEARTDATEADGCTSGHGSHPDVIEVTDASLDELNDQTAANDHVILEDPDNVLGLQFTTEDLEHCVTGQLAPPGTLSSSQSLSRGNKGTKRKAAETSKKPRQLKKTQGGEASSKGQTEIKSRKKRTGSLPNETHAAGSLETALDSPTGNEALGLHNSQESSKISLPVATSTTSMSSAVATKLRTTAVPSKSRGLEQQPVGGTSIPVEATNVESEEPDPLLSALDLTPELAELIVSGKAIISGGTVAQTLAIFQQARAVLAAAQLDSTVP